MKKKDFTIKSQTRIYRTYKMFMLGTFSFLCAYMIASAFAPVQNSDAAQLFNVENSRTGYYVNVSGSATLDVSVDATPEGQLVGAVDTITTTTNSPRGYKLFISASPNYLYLNGDPSTSSQGKFSPIGGGLTSATTLGRNTWGFAYDNSAEGVVANNFASSSYYETENPKYPNAGATYSSIPTTDTKIQEINSSNVATSGTELNVYYGLKASTDLPSGTYSGLITYTAISEGVNTNADTMQDFTTAQCQALPTATADNYETAKKELIDVRDGKWYTVAKMADDNCWMTSNLALDGTDSSGAVRTLTPDDSNVSENRALTTNIESGTPSNNTDIQIFSEVAEDATTNCNESYPYCVENPSTKYGNLYNWLAATAGTGTAETTTTTLESVCPKGWRLPDNGGNGVDKSFGNLLSKYTINLDGTGEHLSGDNIDHGAEGGVMVKRVQQAPFYFTLGGAYRDTTIHQTRSLAYWSRTPVSSKPNYAYYWLGNAETGMYSPQYGDYAKFWGFAIRCVFGE